MIVNYQNKCLKCALLFATLGTVALLLIFSQMQCNQIQMKWFPDWKTPKENENITVGIVACGEKAQDKAMTLLKSIILSSERHGVSSTIDVIAFADENSLESLERRVDQLLLQRSATRLKIRGEVQPVIFPKRDPEMWKKFFKPCASERLFFPEALPHINKILYLDVDTLFLGNIEKVWGKFREMGSNQVVGLARETELSSGWYNLNARHPFYPPAGVQSGVILMDLQKLRDSFPWEDSVISTYMKYKKVIWGDQDIINIIFHFWPDALYRLPCTFNYSFVHCKYGRNCEVAKSTGIQILHGCYYYFDKVKGPDQMQMFRKLYEYFEKFDLSKDDYLQDLIIPFKTEMGNATQSLSQLNNSTDTCQNFVDLIQF